jgi:hypothetical protein
MKTFIQFFSLILLMTIYSCSSSSLKENINKTDDAAGQAIGEFASGVSSGVKKAIEPKIEISENLKNKGLSFGKMTISSDSAGKDNILIAYAIFSVDFSGNITAKAFDNKNLEMGRVKIKLKGKKDEAMFVEFHFDRRTDIKNDSKLILE